MWTEVEAVCRSLLYARTNPMLRSLTFASLRLSAGRNVIVKPSKPLTPVEICWNATKKTSDAVLIANADNAFKDGQLEKDKLEIFKKDLGTFARFYEFMSQIVD